MEAEEWYYVSNGKQVCALLDVLVVDGTDTIQKSSRGVERRLWFARGITNRGESSKIPLYGAAC